MGNHTKKNLSCDHMQNRQYKRYLCIVTQNKSIIISILCVYVCVRGYMCVCVRELPL